MGRVIDPSELLFAATTMIEKSTEQIDALVGMQGPINSLAGDEELEGKAWSKTKAQLSDYHTLLVGSMTAYHELQTDAEQLKSVVVGSGESEILNEDQILSFIARLDTDVSVRQQNIETWSSRNGKERPGGKTYDYTVLIYNNQNIISSLQAIRSQLESKLTKIETIESTTNGLFLNAQSLFDAVSAGVQEVKGAWTGSEFKANSGKGWREELTETWMKNRTDIILRAECITEDQLKHMGDLGYSQEQVADLLIGCEREKDREFIKALASQDYKKAFAINPKELGEVTTLSMADYAMRLAAWSEANEADMESFYNFNNAVLQVREGASLGEIALHTNHAEAYLLKLSTGTKSILGSEAMLIAMGEDDLKERNKRLMTMANLWSSQYILFKEYTATKELANYRDVAGMSVSGFEYNVATGRFDYTMNISLVDYPFNGDRSGKGNPVEEKLSINTALVFHGDELEDLHFLEHRRELEAETEKLKDNLVKKMGTKVGMTALSAISPGTVFALGVLSAVGDADPGELKLEALAKVEGLKGNEYYEKCLDNKFRAGALDLASEYVKYQKAYSKALIKINEDDLERKLEWFGSGGYYKNDGKLYTSFEGIYNPNTIQKMMEWEKGGFYEFASKYWRDDDGNLVDLKLNKKNFEKKIIILLEEDNDIKNKGYVKDLITGNIDLAKITDMGEFTTGIKDLKLLIEELLSKPKEESAVLPSIQRCFR